MTTDTQGTRKPLYANGEQYPAHDAGDPAASRRRRRALCQPAIHRPDGHRQERDHPDPPVGRLRPPTANGSTARPSRASRASPSRTCSSFPTCAPSPCCPGSATRRRPRAATARLQRAGRRHDDRAHDLLDLHTPTANCSPATRASCWRAPWTMPPTWATSIKPARNWSSTCSSPRTACITTVTHDMGGYFDLTGDEGTLVRKDMVNALEAMGIKVETVAPRGRPRPARD